MTIISHHAGRTIAARDFFSLPVLGGLLLIALMICVRILAPRFIYGSNMHDRPVILIVAVLMIAGVVYLAVAISVLHARGPSRGIAWMLLVGLLMRLAMVGTNPILEDDYYRYLWDGGVSAHGHNPYAWIPGDVLDGKANVPENLLALGESSGQVLRRVNHPELGTVYPPVVAGVFALAHLVRPWSTAGLKLFYLAFDLATLALLFSLLRRLNKPGIHALIYWWNPLFIKETYNSVHMDVIIAPFVLGALLCALDRRVWRAVCLVACGIASKIWPVLLAPLMLWPLRRSPSRMVFAAVMLAVVALILMSPLLPAQAHGSDSGFVAYGERWEMNDALFMVFPWMVGRIAAAFAHELDAGTAHSAGRVIAAALVLFATLAATLYAGNKTRQRLPGAMLFVVATLFLVSPTQFPWYMAWILPLLVLQPRVSLLLLTVMMPLYYLRFYFAAHGNVDFFHYRVVWIEYAPVWIALAIELKHNGAFPKTGFFSALSNRIRRPCPVSDRAQDHQD